MIPVHRLHVDDIALLKDAGREHLLFGAERVADGIVVATILFPFRGVRFVAPVVAVLGGIVSDDGCVRSAGTEDGNHKTGAVHIGTATVLTLRFPAVPSVDCTVLAMRSFVAVRCGEVILVVLVLGEHGLDRLGGTECLVDGLTGSIGANTRFLRGVGKPRRARRLEDEHCGHDRSEHLRFLDSSENLHVFFLLPLFAWFSVASLVVRLNCVSRCVLSLTEVISADSPGVVFLVLPFPIIVCEALVLRDFCIADALDGGFGVAHDAGNLIIRVCRVRMFQVVEHGDGAAVDGLHCGIGVTQLLHGEEPLAVYQLIALPPQELFAVLLEPDYIVQLIWRDEEHGAPDLTGGGGNLGALKGHLSACVLRISVIPVLCENDAVFLKGTEVEVPVGKDVRSLRAERLGVRLGG